MGHCGRNCESKKEASLYGSGIQCNITGRNFPKRGKAPSMRRKAQRFSPRVKSAQSRKNLHVQAKAAVTRGISRVMIAQEIKMGAYLHNRKKYGLPDGRWCYRGRYIPDASARRAHGI